MTACGGCRAECKVVGVGADQAVSYVDLLERVADGVLGRSVLYPTNWDKMASGSRYHRLVPFHLRRDSKVEERRPLTFGSFNPKPFPFLAFPE
jgi:hypothetical protein